MDLELLSSLKNAAPKVLVVGDIMLDRYTEGLVERVSPEAPVLVIRVEGEEVRLGGAASVAALLSGMGAKVDVAGVVGKDSNALIIERLFSDAGINAAAVLRDELRSTTVKWRLLGRPEHRIAEHLLRIDYESRSDISAELEDAILEQVTRQLDEYQSVLISDYGKGVCTARLTQEVIRLANSRGIPVVVDPVIRGDFQKYRGSSVLKPNRATASHAIGTPIQVQSEAGLIAKRVCEMFELGAAVITMDKDGMVYHSRDGSSGVSSAAAPYVRDITGAGDMAQAVLGYSLALGVALDKCLHIANLASGLQVARDGVAIVSWDEIIAAARGRSGKRAIRHGEKVVSQRELEQLARQYRSAGKRVVFTNGCFDILHVGHLTYLQEAAELGDVLVVAINSDAMIRRLKGSERPVNCLSHRALVLAGLECVDHVVEFEEPTPHKILTRLKPDVLVKGGTYKVEEVVGREVVWEYGGEVMVLGEVPGVSTTHLIRKSGGVSKVR